MKTIPLLLRVALPVLFLSVIQLRAVKGQVVCSEDTPYFYVDLSTDADSVYLSPAIQRDGSCCGSMFPDVCIEFTVLLASSAVGLEFDIFSGAEPPGALFYQIDCGQIVMVGEEICLQGGQEYTITFCKPGANQNVYSIRSIQAPITVDTLTTRINCSVELGLAGPIDSTIVWRDVSSPDERYNAYLSCTMGCDTTTFTPDENSPPQVRYEVCGTYVPENCDILPVTVCDTVVVNVLPEVQAGLSSTPIVFCEDNIQSVTTTINLPIEDITFEWYDDAAFQSGGPPIATSSSFIPPAANTYWLIATDTTFGGCNMDTANVEVIFQPLPEFSFPNASTICEGASESILLPDQYTYQWSPDENITQTPGTNLFTLSPGNSTSYTLVATDEFGCSASNTLTIEVIPEFNVNLTTSEVTFCADNILPIQAQLSGPGGDISLEWYDTATGALVGTGPSLLPPSSGIYQIIATNNDLSACNVDVAEVTVNIQQLPVFEVPDDFILCFGETAEIELTDGFQYNWTPGNTVDPIIGTNRFILSPSESTSYTITAMDNLGCSDNQEVNVEVAPEFGVAISPEQYLFCEGSIQPIAAELIGGESNVTFRWYEAETDALNFTGQQFLPPAGGEYYVVATNNALQACNLDTAFVSIQVQPAPVFDLPTNTTLCSGESTSFTLPDGYSYAWSPDNSVNPVLGTNTFELTPSNTTNYTVTATDPFGCVFSTTTEVEVIPPFGIAINSPTVEYCIDNVQPIEAQLTGIGGNIQVQWYSIDNNTVTFTGNPFLPPSSGSYLATATHFDLAACNTDTAMLEVTINNLPEINIPEVVENCGGETNTITLEPGDIYNWSPSGGVSLVSGTNVFEVDPFQSTNYTIIAQNAAGCQSTDNLQVNVGPSFMVATSANDLTFCENEPEAIIATISGQGGDINYSWYDSLTLVLGGAPLASGNTFVPPTSSTYAVIVSNESFDICNTDTAWVSVVVEAAPQLDLPGTFEVCEGSPAILILPDEYEYNWVPDIGITPLTQAGQFSILPNSDLTYTVVATNAAGCGTNGMLPIDLLPAPIADTGIADELNCSNNTVQLSGNIINNSAIIDFGWQGPAGGISAGASSLTPTVVLPGWYFLQANNTENGCISIDSVQVDSNFQLPIAQLPDLVEIDCNELEAIIDGTASSTGTNFSYSWTNLDENPVQQDGSSNLTVDQVGFYELVVTNTSNGCTASDITEVIAIPPITTLNFDANQICFGTNNGVIDVGVVEGGTPPYLYSLNGSPFFNITSFGDLEAGIYSLGVQDANGCQIWENVEIETYERIELDLGPSVQIASGDIYELSFSTNLEPFLIDSLLWSPPPYLSCTSCPNPVASPILSTTFSLTLTDVFGCQASDSIRVRLIEEEIVYIPNAFSPNGDDNNDRFLIYTRPGIGQIEFLRIFDRWGNMVFEAYDFPPNEPLFGWDGIFQGETMNPAVFVYHTKINLINGTSVTKKGDVTLVR